MPKFKIKKKKKNCFEEKKNTIFKSYSWLNKRLM